MRFLNAFAVVALLSALFAAAIPITPSSSSDVIEARDVPNELDSTLFERSTATMGRALRKGLMDTADKAVLKVWDASKTVPSQHRYRPRPGAGQKKFSPVPVNKRKGVQFSTVKRVPNKAGGTDWKKTWRQGQAKAIWKEGQKKNTIRRPPVTGPIASRVGIHAATKPRSRSASPSRRK